MNKLSFIATLLLCVSIFNVKAQDLSRGYDVSYYDLFIDLNNLTGVFDGKTTIEFKQNLGIDSIRLDAYSNLQIQSVVYNGKAVRFTHQNNVLSFAAEFGSKGKAEVYYHRNQSDNSDRSYFTSIETRIDIKTDFVSLSTTSEPMGAADWFPCKQVLNDKADSVKLSINVPKELYAIATGSLLGKYSITSEKNRFVWKSNYPIAYYLISFAVGNYHPYQLDIPVGNDTVKTINYIYNDPELIPTNIALIKEITPVMQQYCQWFGLYPFANEKYGQVLSAIGGGMENQTLTILDYFDFGLMAHELAHSWFGNMVTCSSWNDIWLHEGLASYLEYLAIKTFKGEIASKSWLKQAHDYAEKVADLSLYISNDDISNPYKIFNYGLSYKKGVMMVLTLSNEINNDELFMNILRTYLKTYAYKNASMADFIKIVNNITQQDYTWFFDQWYYGIGIPSFDMKWSQKGKKVNITVSQIHQNNDIPIFKMHFDVVLVYETGIKETIRLYTDVEKQSYVLKNKDKIKNVLFDPDFKLLRH